MYTCISSFKKFFKALQCSFYPSLPPLVAQPLIKQLNTEITIHTTTITDDHSSESSFSQHHSTGTGRHTTTVSSSEAAYKLTRRIYPYLQYDTWHNSSKKGGSSSSSGSSDDDDIIAVTTDFIEMQAPIIHTGFFLWYIQYVIKPTLAAANILGADYGYDNVSIV